MRIAAAAARYGGPARRLYWLAIHRKRWSVRSPALRLHIAVEATPYSVPRVLPMALERQFSPPSPPYPVLGIAVHCRTRLESSEEGHKARRCMCCLSLSRPPAAATVSANSTVGDAETAYGPESPVRSRQHTSSPPTRGSNPPPAAQLQLPISSSQHGSCRLKGCRPGGWRGGVAAEIPVRLSPARTFPPPLPACPRREGIADGRGPADRPLLFLGGRGAREASTEYS